MRSFSHRRRLSFVLTKQEHGSCVTNFKLLTPQKDEAVTRYQSRRINGAQRSEATRTYRSFWLYKAKQPGALSLSLFLSLSLPVSLSQSLSSMFIHARTTLTFIKRLKNTTYSSCGGHFDTQHYGTRLPFQSTVVSDGEISRHPAQGEVMPIFTCSQHVTHIPRLHLAAQLFSSLSSPKSQGLPMLAGL